MAAAPREQRHDGGEPGGSRPAGDGGTYEATMVDTDHVREIVAALYVLGAVVTAAGVLLAYRRARRDLGRLKKVATLQASREDVDLTQDLEAVIAGDEEGLAARAARGTRRASEQAELDRAVAAAGIPSGGPSWNDLTLPLDYWAKRSALRDAVASFWTGGLVALTGLAISTGASVWSLYLSSP